MGKRFEPARADGRTDAQVVFDLCANLDSGDTLTYQQLIDGLQAGVPTKIDRRRAYVAVGKGNRKLLDLRQRYLRVVANVGYRMLAASEHLETALTKRDTAEGYLRRGLEILRGTSMSELTHAQRVLHEGQMMILGGVYRMVKESTKRHEKHEAAIDELRKRVDAIECK